jgi:uncharacterized protein (TIGR00369 family)
MSEIYDALQRAMSGASAETFRPPIARLIGFTFKTVTPGKATIEFVADERHANALGTLHGGVMCDVADAAMGIAFASTLERDDSFTTIELKINFMKPVWRAKLRAEGRVIKRGRTIGLVECDLYDEGDSLVAHATSTCMTLRGQAAQGR